MPRPPIALIVMLLAATAFAQTEGQDTPADAPVVLVVTPPPASNLDTADRGPGLTVRTLTKIGDVPDDGGGDLAVYAVAIDDRRGNVTRGLALVVTQRGGRVARSYVDVDEVDALVDGVQALAALDRDGNGQTQVRGVYRTRAGAAVFNVDDNGGRTAVVRTLQVSPLTGQVLIAAARYRSTRLSDVLRQLRAAKDVLDKSAK